VHVGAVTTVDSGEEALKKLRCAKSDTYNLVLTVPPVISRFLLGAGVMTLFGVLQ
jgi:hypothetical protein